MSFIAIIVIWLDPVSTNQVDLDLAVEAGQVRARSWSNLFNILAWEMSLYSYEAMVWYVNGVEY